MLIALFELPSSTSDVLGWAGGILALLVAAAMFGFFLWMLLRVIISFLKFLKKLFVLFWNYPTSLVLVASNAVPLVGVFLLDWTVFEIVYLYWLEVVVYSFFSVAKLKKVLAHTPPESIPHIRITPFIIRRGESAEETVRHIIPDFITTFRLAAVSALILIVLLSGGWRFSFEFLGTPLNLLITTLLSLASFSVSHGVSYVRNFLGKEEYRRITLREQLKAPLNRLGVMWVAIFFGSFLPQNFFGDPLVSLVFIVFIKTAFDVYGHIQEHAKLVKIKNLSP